MKKGRKFIPCRECGGSHCHWCGYRFGKGDARWTREHLLPKFARISKSGIDPTDFIVAAHSLCNGRRAHEKWVGVHERGTPPSKQMDTAHEIVAILRAEEARADAHR